MPQDEPSNPILINDAPADQPDQPDQPAEALMRLLAEITHEVQATTALMADLKEVAPLVADLRARLERLEGVVRLEYSPAYLFVPTAIDDKPTERRCDD